MLLTRQIVDRMLDANTHNRRVSQNHVDSLARFMRDGEFLAGNGQTIVINESFDWLLDGQHRLLAIRKAGYPEYNIDVKIVRDDEAQRVFETIDCNASARTVSCILGLEGFANANRVTALIRALAQFAWRMQNISVEEVKRIHKVLSPMIGMVHVTRGIFDKFKPDANITAGVVNAMLLKPNMAADMEHEWACVLDNNIPPEKKALRSLSSMIVTKTEPMATARFYKATKALLNPSAKNLKIGEGEDVSRLRAKCPPEVAR